MERAILAVLFCLALALPAHAGQLGLLLNGHAMHLKKTTKFKNEENYGLGLQYEDQLTPKWIWFIYSTGYQDSRRDPSYSAGGGLRRRFSFYDAYLDLGGVAGVIAHNSYREGEPVPALLPVASVGWRQFAVNMAYIPEVNKKVVPLVFFQFMYTVDLTPK